MNLAHISTEDLRAELLARGERDLMVLESRALAVRIMKHMSIGVSEKAIAGHKGRWSCRARWAAIGVVTMPGIGWTDHHTAQVFRQTVGNIRAVKRRNARECKTNEAFAEKLRKTAEYFSIENSELL